MTRPVTEAPPREGLQPCESLTIFDDRLASCVDKTRCDGNHGMVTRFYVAWGTVTEWDKDLPGEAHPGARAAWLQTGGAVETDDEAEALAAYERACYWVLYGEMP